MRFISAMQLRKAAGVGFWSLLSDWPMSACMEADSWAWILTDAIIMRAIANTRSLKV
jgi:hypothetical protein